MLRKQCMDWWCEEWEEKSFNNKKNCIKPASDMFRMWHFLNCESTER